MSPTRSCTALALLGRSRVDLGPEPVAEADHFGICRNMSRVRGNDLVRMMIAARQHPQRDRVVRRTCGRRARLFNRPGGLVRADRNRRHLAHLALARPHRYGAVALQGLDVVEPFNDGVADVFFGHVLADAHEALAAAVRGQHQGRIDRQRGQRLAQRREFRRSARRVEAARRLQAGTTPIRRQVVGACTPFASPATKWWGSLTSARKACRSVSYRPRAPACRTR